ncbi:MAG: hypothetical protein HQM12_16505 [SAR324 cluster bacterium]|nr:hypothetical protein [SAR324 cluster bacterium]
MKKKQKTKIFHWQLQGNTNFYPRYGEGRDVVTAVSAIQASAFQEIVPRYQLSASETRDQGVGPFFNEIEYRSPAFKKVTRKALGKLPEKTSEAPPKKRKIRINFFA